MWLLMIFSFDYVEVANVGLPCELSKRNSIFKNQGNGSYDVVRSLICRSYNIFVENIAIVGCFCAHWHYELSDSNLNKRPNSFDPFWKGFNRLFFSFCPFSGIVLHRVNQKFEVVFPIYGLWLTICWTFCKVLRIFSYSILLTSSRNDVTSGIIFE